MPEKMRVDGPLRPNAHVHGTRHVFNNGRSSFYLGICPSNLLRLEAVVGGLAAPLLLPQVLFLLLEALLEAWLLLLGV